MLTDTIKINTIRSLSKGWDIQKEPGIIDKKKKEIEKESNVIGLLGGSYKGKSFLLRELLKTNKKDFPQIEQDITSGKILNAHYITFKNTTNDYSRQSSSLYETILEPSFKTLSTIDVSNMTKEEVDKINCDEFQVQSLIENFIIEHSTILIYIMEYPTLHELRVMNKIKQSISKETKFIIIHNLKSLTKRKEVYQYIKTFKETQSNIVIMNMSFLLRDNQNTIELFCIQHFKNFKIVHLFMGNNNENQMNQGSLYYLSNLINFSLNKKKFAFIEEFENYLKLNLAQYIEKFDVNKIKIENDKIVIKEPKTIEPKYNFELLNEFKFDIIYPNYAYKYDNNKLIITIESGFESSISSIDISTELNTYIICIMGKKECADNLKKEIAYHSNIEFGDFIMNLSLPMSKGLLASIPSKDSVETDSKNGILTIKFDLIAKKQLTCNL